MSYIRVSIIWWRVAFIPPIGDMMVGLKSKPGSDSIDALRSSAHPTRAVGGVTAIALIGHNQCGMVNLMARRDLFIQGLVNAGWEKEWADEHFMHFAPMFEVGNEVDFVLSEAKRLRLRYPKIQVAPLMYRVEDNRLYLIQEN
jgi:carbonic anhydrase